MGWRDPLERKSEAARKAFHGCFDRDLELRGRKSFTDLGGRKNTGS